MEPDNQRSVRFIWALSARFIMMIAISVAFADWWWVYAWRQLKSNERLLHAALGRTTRCVTSSI